MTPHPDAPPITEQDATWAIDTAEAATAAGELLSEILHVAKHPTLMEELHELRDW